MLVQRPGLIRPSLLAGPPGTTDAIKIPRSRPLALSSPTIIIPCIKTKDKLQLGQEKHCFL